ncbi:MAG: 6-bladed beta-propeller [Candidatus Aegiribacteria sp.]|nr:6-bladed beta-propeller [Candidatus Aegiribacteria sp.]
MKMSMIIILLLLLLASCDDEGEVPAGEQQNDAVETSDALPEIDIYLAVTDSIGIDVGDSNYVFGKPTLAFHSPGGDIAILDIQKLCILFYSPEGEYIQTVGREGSGPGEFLMPACFTFMSDGGIAVSDVMAGKITFFDSDYEYSGQLIGFFPSAPIAIIGVDSGAIVGMLTAFDQNEEGMFLGFSLARWEGEVESTVEYYSTFEPFDPSDIAASSKDIMFTVTAAPDGKVFCAPLSTDDFIIEGYMPDGTSFLHIEDEDFQKIRKTDEEIQDEIDRVNENMSSYGVEGIIEWEPDLYKTSIVSLHIDSFDRLWVRMGIYSEIVFRVYNMDGELLFTAGVDLPGDMNSFENWQIIVDQHGILAFNSMPDDYPKIYMMEEQ